eukprot:PhM_4_TR14630/c0_g1_i1/m.62902
MDEEHYPTGFVDVTLPSNDPSSEVTYRNIEMNNSSPTCRAVLGARDVNELSGGVRSMLAKKHHQQHQSSAHRAGSADRIRSVLRSISVRQSASQSVMETPPRCLADDSSMIQTTTTVTPVRHSLNSSAASTTTRDSNTNVEIERLRSTVSSLEHQLEYQRAQADKYHKQWEDSRNDANDLLFKNIALQDRLAESKRLVSTLKQQLGVKDRRDATIANANAQLLERRRHYELVIDAAFVEVDDFLRQTAIDAVSGRNDDHADAVLERVGADFYKRMAQRLIENNFDVQRRFDAVCDKNSELEGEKRSWHERVVQLERTLLHVQAEHESERNYYQAEEQKLYRQIADHEVMLLKLEQVGLSAPVRAASSSSSTGSMARGSLPRATPSSLQDLSAAATASRSPPVNVSSPTVPDVASVEECESVPQGLRSDAW